MRMRNLPRVISTAPWLVCLFLAALALPGQALGQNRVTPVVSVVRAAGPAVVNISSTARVRTRTFSSGDDMLDRFFQEFFQPLERSRPTWAPGWSLTEKGPNRHQQPRGRWG